MNNVPRHVVVDLLPVYLAGELSPATRGFALAATEPAQHVEASVAMSPDLEVRSVRRTRMILAWQRWLFGLAVGFTAIGLSITASLEHARVENVHLMVRDYPLPFGMCLVMALVCWVGYHRVRRRLA